VNHPLTPETLERAAQVLAETINGGWQRAKLGEG
jgi:hypothetical protein